MGTWNIRNGPNGGVPSSAPTAGVHRAARQLGRLVYQISGGGEGAVVVTGYLINDP